MRCEHSNGSANVSVAGAMFVTAARLWTSSCHVTPLHSFYALDNLLVTQYLTGVVGISLERCSILPNGDGPYRIRPSLCATVCTGPNLVCIAPKPGLQEVNNKSKLDSMFWASVLSATRYGAEQSVLALLKVKWRQQKITSKTAMVAPS